MSVNNNDGIVSVLDYSIENFSASKNYYSFTFNYSIVCNKEKMNYTMRVSAQNSKGEVLAEQSKIFNKTYLKSVYNVFKEGQTYNASINFTIKSKEPITKIVIGG